MRVTHLIFALATLTALPTLAHCSSTNSSSAPAADGGTSDSAPDAAGPIAANFGTFIALGDSITDRGGEAPFYYDLVFKNDDAQYPAWKGKDLSTRYPGAQFVHGAVAGSITGPYPDSASKGLPRLVDQVKKLGNAYAGDVLVVITIGGNDFSAHASDVVLGQDQAIRAQFAANLKAVLDELTTPARLGAGKVVILEANIYDDTDGQGNWTKGGPSCPQFDTGKQVDTAAFATWNKIITDAIAEHSGNDALLDIHGVFAGHGFNGNDKWYAADCIHPNKRGHQELRREVWRMVTGEKISGD